MKGELSASDFDAKADKGLPCAFVAESDARLTFLTIDTKDYEGSELEIAIFG